MSAAFRHLLLSLLFLAALPLTCSAWGVLGHRAVGKIAEGYLTDRARLEIERLLGTETLALVSTWPDEVRPYATFDKYSPWHYLNVRTGLTFDAFQLALNALPTEPADAYGALQHLLGVLKDPARSDLEKVFALKFIVHIVGDVHQPLHVGHAEDKGGNDIKVSWRGKQTNLHGLWDSDLVEYPGLTYTEIALAYDRSTPAQRLQWQQDSIGTWLYESYQLAEVVYAGAAKNPDFDYTYYPTYGPTVQLRLVQAGVRLAGVLNAAFAG
jgi:hypothetical protein